MDIPPQPRHRKMIPGLAPARKSPEGDALPVTVSVAPIRIGHGYDIHKLQPGGRLVVGGVNVSDQLSAVAHSDGDVVIHALVDAILGAMGWGDIGQLFPNTDPQWKDASSRVFLQNVCDRIRDAKCRVAQADITVLAERPTLAPFKIQMVQTLRDILGASSLVNIKACTNEECDSIGRGEAIAAHAVVLLVAEA